MVATRKKNAPDRLIRTEIGNEFTMTGKGKVDRYIGLLEEVKTTPKGNVWVFMRGGQLRYLTLQIGHTTRFTGKNYPTRVLIATKYKGCIRWCRVDTASDEDMATTLFDRSEPFDKMHKIG